MQPIVQSLKKHLIITDLDKAWSCCGSQIFSSCRLTKVIFLKKIFCKSLKFSENRTFSDFGFHLHKQSTLLSGMF